MSSSSRPIPPHLMASFYVSYIFYFFLCFIVWEFKKFNNPFLSPFSETRRDKQQQQQQQKAVTAKKNEI